MIPKEKNLPKIKHTKVDLAEKKKLTAVITNFFKSVVLPKALEKQREGFIGWDDPKHLLDLRKALVDHTKKGMLERKNCEEDIALLACFIWYNRLEDKKRAMLEGSLW
jgi:hypothetical protein